MSHSIDITVSFDHRYSIQVGKGLGKDLSSFCSDRYSKTKVIVVVDEQVWQLHEEKIQLMCSRYFDNISVFKVPQGESSKSLGQWQRLVNGILNEGIERNTPLLAIGGGVTGDLGGYVAASVLRGIPLIHFPTTLLAMVDSSIGGKTGLNHDTGKNLIGAFYQPDAVFADTDFLQTLEKKEWVTGMAEMLKYGAIRNPKLFDKLEILADNLTGANENWVEVISESARIKADIVEEDTLEAGKRAYLNFGHTFGHALEKVAGYGNISHGEAVFAGMVAATYFSRQLGHPVDEAVYKPFMSLYKQQIRSFPSQPDVLIEAMKTDKKVKNNIIQLVLLKEWGSPYIKPCTDLSKLKTAWNYTIDQFN